MFLALSERFRFRNLVAKVKTHIPTTGRENMGNRDPPPAAVWLADDALELGFVLHPSVDFVPAGMIY